MLVFAAASITTAVLSLDATVVLLTPVILTTVRRLGVRGAPHVYATAHLSNSASLLLPVSNLTNLLAFHASGLTFLGFAGADDGPGWSASPWSTSRSGCSSGPTSTSRPAARPAAARSQRAEVQDPGDVADPARR